MIDFNGEFVLEPNKRYSIIFSLGPNEDTYKVFDIYHQYTLSNATKKDVTDKYIQISEAILEKLGIRFNYTPNEPRAFFLVDSVYNSSLKTKYVNIDTEQQHIIATLAGKTAPNLDAPLKDFLKIISSTNVAIDEKYRELYLLDKENINIVNELLKLDDSFYLKTLEGLLSLDCRFCKPTETLNYVDRIKNIDKTIASLSKLELLTKTLSTQFASQITLNSGLESYINYLRTINNNLKNIVKSKTEIEKVISAEKKFNVAELISGDSYIVNFLTRSSYSIVPDFGVVNTTAFANGKDNEYKFMPYLGFHINFRPINKDLNFWSYRHNNIGQFLSAFVGWTMVKVGKDNQRLDFFENSSLLTGLGIRVGNAVRIVGGKMWYFNIEGSQRRVFTNMSFIGVSLDFELEKLFNGFKSLVPNKAVINNQ